MNWQIPALPALLARAVRSGNEKLAEIKEDGNPGRFPVVVKPETRSFLDAQAGALNTSIAGLAGVILDTVAQNTIHGERHANSSFRRIAERLIYVVQEHGLSLPAAATHLSRFGFGIEHVRNPELMEPHLTAERLTQLAKHFHLHGGWLVGNEPSRVTAIPSGWHSSPSTTAVDIGLTLLEDAPHATKLLVIKVDSEPFNDKLEHGEAGSETQRFQLYVERSYRSGAEILSTYQKLHEGNWSYFRHRNSLVLLVHYLYRLGVYTDGLYVPAAAYAGLEADRTLVAPLLNRNTTSRFGRLFNFDCESLLTILEACDPERVQRENRFFEEARETREAEIGPVPRASATGRVLAH